MERKMPANQLDGKLPRSHFTPLTLFLCETSGSLGIHLGRHWTLEPESRISCLEPRLWNPGSRDSNLKRTSGEKTSTVLTAVIAACAKGVHARLRVYFDFESDSGSHSWHEAISPGQRPLVAHFVVAKLIKHRRGLSPRIWGWNKHPDMNINGKTNFLYMCCK